MAEAKVQTVLRRKAEAGRVEVVEAPPLTPDRALAQGLARAAQELMGLALRATACREARMTLADMPEALPDHALIALVEGPGEALGIVAVAPDLFGAVIEMLTVGKLGPRAAPARRPTRTDAAMTAEFVDRFLVEIEALLAPLPAARWGLGYSYASFLEDPRPLGLLLEDIPYRVFTLDLDLGTGPTRPGRMILVLPAEARGLPHGFRPRAAGNTAAPPGEAIDSFVGEDAPHVAAEPAGEAAAGADTADTWSSRLETTVLGLSAGVEAVLHRVTLPLSAVLALRPGMDLPIPAAAMENLRIEGLGGRYLARARLGQNRGFRAVRISAAEEQARTEDAAESEGAGRPFPTDPAAADPSAQAALPAVAEFPPQRLGIVS